MYTQLKQIITGLFMVSTTVLTSTSLMAQVKIGTNPTTIGANNNLEVEASTAGRKTSIDKTSGQVTIKDGTEGTAKVLTSDLNGASSWQRIPRTTRLFFQQAVGDGVLLVVPSGTSACQNGASSPDLTCAKNLNIDGTFTTTQAVNDIEVELLSTFQVSQLSGTISGFSVILYVDKDAPGVFSNVEFKIPFVNGVACTTKDFTIKALLKDFPPRTYTFRTFVGAWFSDSVNPNDVQVGFSIPARPGICGTTAPQYTKMFVNVTE